VKPGNIILALFLVIGVFLVMMGLQIVTFSTAFIFIAILTVVALILIAISLNKTPAAKAKAAAPAVKTPPIKIEPPKPELPKILQSKPAPAPAPPASAPEPSPAPVEAVAAPQPLEVITHLPEVSEPTPVPVEPLPTPEPVAEMRPEPAVELQETKPEVILAPAAEPVSESTLAAAPQYFTEPSEEPRLEPEPAPVAEVQSPIPEATTPLEAPAPSRPQWAPAELAAAPISQTEFSAPAEPTLLTPKVVEGSATRQEPPAWATPVEKIEPDAPPAPEAAPPAREPVPPAHETPVGPRLNVRAVPPPLLSTRLSRGERGTGEARSIPADLSLGLAQLRQEWFAAWVEGVRRFNRQHRQAGVRIPLEHPRLGGEAEIALRVFQLQLVVDYLRRYPYLRGDEAQDFLAKLEHQMFGAEQEQCEAHWRQTVPGEGQAAEEPDRYFAAHVPAIGTYLASSSETKEMVAKLLEENLQAWVENNQLEIAQALGDKRTASKLSNRLRQGVRPARTG
jgi:hypothetical protein